MRILILIFFSFFCFDGYTQKVSRENFHSTCINDDYEISFRFPKNYSANISYNIIYVADGSLKLGKYILGDYGDWKATISDSCIIVAIAHKGDWHVKRQRDFIPSDEGGYSDDNFGKADDFYYFLKYELIPHINQKFVKQKSTAFIGHSFSGLFCLYLLFREDKLFDRHFAISPSVWANDEELLKIELAFYKRKKVLKANLFLQAGGLEIFNKVLFSTNEFYERVIKHYSGLQISYSKVNNANHFSIIKPAVDKILALYSK
ncbi:MAG: alpha/beta hydrolase [Sphingobacteriales bacterium]|nr:MAG: alpha/beta hydrolase [Sphingobacteriales bacterium]